MTRSTKRSSPLPGWLKIVGLVFTIAALVFAGLLVVRHGGDLARQWSDLRAAGWRLRPGWLLLALTAATANLFILGGAWIRLLRELGGNLGYVEGIRIWTWTNLGRYLPGKVWQISALTVYLRERKQIGGIGLGSNIALQVLMLAVGAAVAFGTLGIRIAEGSTALTVAAALATTAGLVVALRPSTVARVSRRMAGWMGEPWTGGEPRRAALREAALIVLLSWFINGVGLWCLWRGVGATGGPDPLFWTGAFAAAYLVGYAALFAPAGLVVREVSLAGLLVGLGGVAAAPAAGIALLSRLWAIASELLAAAIAWMLPGKLDLTPEPAADRAPSGSADTSSEAST